MAEKLTRSEQNARHEILTPVRGALRGWAFADTAARLGRLRTAEGVLSGLPALVQSDGQRLIDPLRAALGLPEVES